MSGTFSKDNNEFVSKSETKMSNTTTVFIHETALRFKDQFAPGHVITADEATALNALWLSRFISRAGWWLRKQPEPISATTFAAELLRIATDVAALDSAIDDSDPIREEGMQLARDMIIAKLAAENLPAPTGIDIHAEELLEGMPALMDQARRRVEIRREVAAKTLNALEVAL